MSQLLSSLKVTLGNKFPESLIRIDYTRYDDCYRIRRALSYFYGVYFCFIPASLSCFARRFYAFPFFDELLGCDRQCLGRDRTGAGAF